MTTCEPCALRDEEGDTARAESIEAIRAQRLLLAYMKGSNDGIRLIAEELGDCHDCKGRLAVLYMSMSAEYLAHICGGKEAAITVTERGLAEDIYGQQD